MPRCCAATSPRWTVAATDTTLPAGPAPGLHRGQAQPWATRLRDLLAAYLPLLLMAVLALGTWWLVKSSPNPQDAAPALPARHVPDYTMERFSVQRFAADGRLQGQIEGDQLRHYPDTDTIEIDNARIHAYGPTGQLTVATARRALSNGDGSEVQLIGNAEVQREAVAGQPAINFRGEFLHAFFNTEELRSHLPVVVRRGATELHADGLNYKNLDQQVKLDGRVRASFPPAVRRKAP